VPLQEQYVELPLTGGIDEKSNKEGDVSGLFALENYEYDDTDSIRWRHGFVRQAAWTANQPHALVKAGNSLAAVDGSGTVSFFNGTVPLGTTATINPTSHVSRGTFWNGYRVYACEVSASDGYFLVALAEYVENSGGWTRQVSWKLVDRTTDTVVSSGTIAGTGDGAYYPRCAYLSTDNVFQLYWVQGTMSAACTLKAITIKIVVGPNVFATTTVDTDVRANTSGILLDVASFSSGSYATFLKFSATNMRVVLLNSSGTVAATFNDTTSTYSSVNGGPAISVSPTNDEVTVIYGDGSDVHASVYPKNLASRTRGTKGGTPVYTGSGAFFGTFAACPQSSTSHLVVVLVQIATGDNLTRTYDASSNAVVAVATTKACTVVTKPFVAEGQVYAGFQLNNAQTSGFPNVLVCDVMNPGAHGQFAFDEAGLGIGTSSVFQINNGNTFLTACVVNEETADAQNSTVPVGRVRVVEMTMALAALPAANLNEIGFVGGSLPRVWDGTSFSLAGFVVAPTAPALTTFGTGLTGAYSYCVLYEFSDAKGNIGVSPVSHIASITLSNQGVTAAVAVPVLADPGRPIRVKLYRTVAGGSTFNLAQVVVVTSAGTVSITDNVSDTTLASAEVLYTTGNALESELLPPIASLVSHGNRLFGLRSDDPRTIAFTQEATDPFLPRWNAVLTLRVDNEGGDPRALASLDDKVVVFQDNQITAFTGTGPDGTGAGSYSVPEVVARGVGVDANNVFSVCTIPDGVLFRHGSGIYMLDRSLAVSPVGLPVQRTLGTHAIVRARYLASRHQAWFILDDGSILVLDTRYQRWSHFTFTFAATFIDVLEVAGTVYALAVNAGAAQTEVWKLDTTTYVDKADGSTPSYFSHVVKLAWFRGAGRNGAQRLWKIGLHGELVNGAGVAVTIDAYTQNGRELAKNADTRDTSFSFASLAAYPAGGLRLPVRLVTQRCDAFRCDITTTPSTTDVEGLRLNKVSYTYGVEDAKGKAPVGRRPSAT
jgi:hypothetical protein